VQTVCSYRVMAQQFFLNWARRDAEAKTDGINLSLRIDQTSSRVEICSKIGLDLINPC